MLAGASSRSGVLRECMTAYLLTLQKHMVLCYYSTGSQQAKAAFDDVQARKDDLMEKYSQEYEHSEEYSEIY